MTLVVEIEDIFVVAVAVVVPGEKRMNYLFWTAQTAATKRWVID